MEKATRFPVYSVMVFQVLVGGLIISEPAIANSVTSDSIHCNDLCRSWMGYDKDRSRAGSFTGERKPAANPLDDHYRSATIKQPIQMHHSKLNNVKSDRAVSVTGSAILEPPKATAVKLSPLKLREAHERAPLPVPRPEIVNSPLAMAVDASQADALRHLRLPHKPTEAAALSRAEVMPTVPIRAPLIPAPDLPITPDTANLIKGPSNIASALPVVDVVPSPIVSHPVPISATANSAVKPTADSNAGAGAPTTAELANKPSDRIAADPAPTTSPPTIVASLPSSVDTGAESSIDEHSHPVVHDNSLQITPEAVSSPLRVTVGQISTDTRGTDIHVVVVNVLRYEAKDVDIRCRARDAQGLQVAEASAHIASIAPSDVAFDQVILPSEITTRDNSFSCEVGWMADALP